MRQLQRTLEDYDIGHLRILAELWGFDPPSGSARQAASLLARQMLDPPTAHEIVESLPPAAQKTLAYFQRNEGRAPLSDLIRTYGPLREMGAGRRDREKPWRSPASTLEVLWFRGIIARAFADSDAGPQEFAFIPDDLLRILPQAPHVKHEPFGQPSSAPPIRTATSSSAVDDATTILAALRQRPSKGDRLTPERHNRLADYLLQPDSLDLLLSILWEASILRAKPLCPDPDGARSFLEANRSEALTTLFLSWFRSTGWNDLQGVQHLEHSGDSWPNDPNTSRRAAILLLREIPLGTWWDLEGFIEDVHKQQPSFQRPAGDFSSWYFRDRRTNSILHGIEDWYAVDGALLRYLLTGPLHWLGAVDLGQQKEDEPASNFRLTPAITLLYDSEATLTIKESSANATLSSDGRIRVPRRAVRSLRYQIARFTAWQPIDEEDYLYRITPSALQSAHEQGLELTHIHNILESAVGKTMPSSLAEALSRWSERGSEAWIERSILLRVHEPETLDLLRENRSTARYLHETLGPTTALIREQDWPRLCTAAARLGLLIDPPILVAD